jgi:hypothetical protein
MQVASGVAFYLVTNFLVACFRRAIEIDLQEGMSGLVMNVGQAPSGSPMTSRPALTLPRSVKGIFLVVVGCSRLNLCERSFRLDILLLLLTSVSLAFVHFSSQLALSSSKTFQDPSVRFFLD